jgi:hypothetical protein
MQIYSNCVGDKEEFLKDFHRLIDLFIDKLLFLLATLLII